MAADIAAPFGGSVLLVDKSANARAMHPLVRDRWVRALRAGQLASCTVSTLELLYSARSRTEIDDLLADQALLRDVPITVSVQRTAIAAVRDLAGVASLDHRVPLPDLLLAAAAQEAGIGVLHYDRHFDRLAEVLTFESVWLAPPGALD